MLRYRLRTLLIVLVIAALIAAGVVRVDLHGPGRAIQDLNRIAPDVVKRNEEVCEMPAPLLKPLPQWSSDELERLKRETEHRPGPKSDPPPDLHYSPFPNGYPKPDDIHESDPLLPLAAPPLPSPIPAPG
jgi:hypothetical protein